MKKNILIVLHGLGFGGTEISAKTIGNSLYKIGYNITYLTHYNHNEKVVFLGKEICLNQKDKFGTFGSILNMFKNAYYIKKISKDNNIDTIISHYEMSNFASLFSKIFFLNQPKLLINIHTNPIEAYKNNFLTTIFIKYFYNFADNTIVVSKELGKIILNEFNVKNIININNGFDINLINHLSNEKIDKKIDFISNKNFKFITIGRLVEVKNHKLLLKAFDKLNHKYKNISLFILGDGELGEDLKNQKELLKSKENIHFLGNQNNPFSFMNNSDCFVLSSFYEGFPMVIPEALTCSLPVISTDCKTGPKEILNNTIYNYEEVKDIKKSDYGILIPNNNLDKLYEAMEMIYLDENLRNNYKKKSLERSKDFDINKIIKEWEKII